MVTTGIQFPRQRNVRLGRVHSRRTLMAQPHHFTAFIAGERI